MSVFSELVHGVTMGLVSAATETTSAREIVEACCRDLDWCIDERLSADDLRLHFKDPVVGIRKVVVTIGDHDTSLTFQVFSAVNLPAASMPIEVLGYLLGRNSETFVAWQMRERGGGNVALALSYCAPASGFYPALFKLVCETMANEAFRFDSKMKEAGLL